MSTAIAAQQPVYEMTDKDRERQKVIAAAWQAYNGELDPPLEKMPGMPDDNVLSNRCRQVVDRGVDFLFGKELEISVADAAPDVAQDIINKVWGRKEARIPLLQKLAMSGAIAKNAFLRIVPGNQAFRLVVVDPATVYVQTAPQDYETVLVYCIEYVAAEMINGKMQPVYYREEITRVDPSDDDSEGYEDEDADGLDADVTWRIGHWTRVGDRGPWTPAGEPIAWAYPFPPMFSCQNLPNPCDFWGIADITSDIIGINKALNLVQSGINRDGKLFSHPIIYATGTGEQIIDINPGRITGLPSDNSKIVAVPIPTDIANMLAFAATLRSDIDEQTGVPGVATGRITDMPRGNLSGIAIELLFMPLLVKTEKKRCLYGELIINVSKALLVLHGLREDIDITLAWQNPLPHDDLPSVQAAIAKLQVGISRTSLQRELGYDPEEEEVLSQTEDEKKLLAFTRGQGLPPNPPANMPQPQGAL